MYGEYGRASERASQFEGWKRRRGPIIAHPLPFSPLPLTHRFEPLEVWELRFADLTLSPVYPAARGLVSEDRGLSCRFPRFIRRREDKGVEQASTPGQLELGLSSRLESGYLESDEAPWPMGFEFQRGRPVLLWAEEWRFTVGRLPIPANIVGPRSLRGTVREAS